MDDLSSELDNDVAFDTYDTRLYLFDDMDRSAAENLLRVADVGTFLIRKSATKLDSYSLSVRISLEDDNSIRHFIIQQRTQGTGVVYHMNGADYRDLPTLVTHFTINQLGSSKNSTYLRQPAPKQVLQTVKSTHKFCGERATDLPFNFGETLEILEKPEEEWWIARNAMGAVGFVPANYLERNDYQKDSYNSDVDPYSGFSKSASPESTTLVQVVQEISEVSIL